MSHPDKRQVDFQVIFDWVKPKSRVLDLGCGRGVLLEQLIQRREVNGMGVDIELDKVSACVRRKVPAYHGTIETALAAFDENSFDHVIISRTLEVIENPAEILKEALRVGQTVMVGLINHAWWINRVNLLVHGRRTVNAVLPDVWKRSGKLTLFAIRDFESFCDAEGILIHRRHYFRGDWQRECRIAPNLRAGYALYEIQRG